MGQLVPVSCFEVLPGDTVQMSSSALLRVSPLNAPVMHPVTVRLHSFFVPHRLVWAGWEDFITGGPDGEGGSAGTYPTITAGGGGFAIGSLPDYLGLPTGVAGIGVSALPIRSANLIFNEFYRDQDLVTALTVPTTSGADATSPITIQNIAWEKDYFTSSRPWTQKGPQITIPVGELAPVVGIGKSTANFTAGPVTARETGGGTPSYANYAQLNSGSADNAFFVEKDPASAFPAIYADLSEASGVDINTLREALSFQRYAENRARFGSRYVEYLRYLGVRARDSRLQRPEYLGGGKQTIAFSEVLQTGVTTDGDDTEGVGNIKGHGISAMRSRSFRRFMEEHGVVITFMSVRPRTMYAQGINRMWSRRIKEEYWQQELQHMGQQEVYRRELFAEGDATDDEVFGYQDRYDEYRHIQSGVSGDFRDTLDFWHMARLFGSNPTLNGSFVTCDPTKRINQVQTEDTLWIMVSNRVVMRRLVTKNAAPRTF